MDSLIKFKYIHTDHFHPDGLETVFSGVANIVEMNDDDYDSVIVEIMQVFADGIEVPCFPSNNATGFMSGEWTRFLSTMEGAALSCNNAADQGRIKLPPGNLYDKANPLPTRRNLEEIKGAIENNIPGASGILIATVGNAKEVDFDFQTYEII